jgi:hypothetical protein
MLKKIQEAVINSDIVWQKHALQRILERGITRVDVKETILTGEIIEFYEKDNPYPSVLILGNKNTTPLHVVASLDINTNTCYIITVYKPGQKHFKEDLKTRRK